MQVTFLCPLGKMDIVTHRKGDGMGFHADHIENMQGRRQIRRGEHLKHKHNVSNTLQNEF